MFAYNIHFIREMYNEQSNSPALGAILESPC